MKQQPLQSLITPEGLHHLRCSGDTPEIVDVRTAAEFESAHVPGALSLPLHELNVDAFLRQRGESGAPLYVICQSGSRASKAIAQFQRAGFRACVLVTGGMEAWQTSRLPVEGRPSRIWPLQRQVHLIVGLSAIAGSLLAIAKDPWFALVPLVTGCGLTINGLTGWCGLGLILARMPWNQTNACSTAACCEGETL
jgi:rhodanese-related sulfurtransferase